MNSKARSVYSMARYLRETGYVLKKLGVDFHNVSVTKPA
jgi:hypothetical protein